MPKKEAPLDYLRRFIPDESAQKAMDYLVQYKVHLTITRERKTVLGDYRHATLHKTHRISVNGSLNQYAFLITLIHELAHLVAFLRFGNRIQAHGREWKNVYGEMLVDFMKLPVFPADIRQSLSVSLHDLPASSCADEPLMRVLRKYDPVREGQLLVEQVAEGKLFDTGEGRIFKKGKKLRKRYQCVEVKTGKLYLFSPVYEVREIAS
jgi:SprT protein